MIFGDTHLFAIECGTIRADVAGSDPVWANVTWAWIQFWICGALCGDKHQVAEDIGNLVAALDVAGHVPIFVTDERVWRMHRTDLLMLVWEAWHTTAEVVQGLPQEAVEALRVGGTIPQMDDCYLVVIANATSARISWCPIRREAATDYFLDLSKSVEVTVDLAYFQTVLTLARQHLASYVRE